MQKTQSGICTLYKVVWLIRAEYWTFEGMLCGFV